MTANGDGFTVKEILTEIVIPRLDEIASSTSAAVAEQNARIDKAEERVNSLESYKDKVFGVLALIVAIVVPISVPTLIAIVNSVHH